MSLARISVTVAAGLVTAVTAMQAVAPNAIGSALAPTSSLARLISRTRSAKVQRPDARLRSGATIRAPRQTPSRSNGISGGASASVGIGVQLGPGARSRCPTCRCSGRRPVSSRSMIAEPGPRGSTVERRTPRGPGSATIDNHLQAFAAERQGVRRSDDAGERFLGGSASTCKMVTTTGALAMVSAHQPGDAGL
jgi:hypothetical protein